MKQLIVLLSVLFMGMMLHAQQPLPCKTISQSDFAGTIPVVYSSCIESSTPLHFGNNTNAIAEASTSIVFKPGAKITVDNGGSFIARINPNAFEVVWFEPLNSGVVPLYEKLELGLQIPTETYTKILNFCHKQGGDEINPFNPQDISVEAVFSKTLFMGFSYSVSRFGFWYEDYNVVSTLIDVDSLYQANGLNSIGIGKKEYLQWRKIEENPYPFRIRFSPPLTGDWKCVINVTLNGNMVFQSDEIQFYVAPSDNPGFVRVGENNKYFKLGDDMFFPAGINLLHPHCRNCGVGMFGTHCSTNCLDFSNPYAGHQRLAEPWCGDINEMNPLLYEIYRMDMEALKGLGVNSFRFILTPWTTDIEFEECNNYYNRLHFAWEIDNIVEKAEQLGLYMIFNTLIHNTIENPSQYKMTHWDWPDNYPGNTNGTDNIAFCYKSTYNLQDPLDFLTNPYAIQTYKNKLRYIASRWGYSTNIMSFELVSEINQIGAGGNYDEVGGAIAGYEGDYKIGINNARQKVFFWHGIMSAYLKNTLKSFQMINPSYTITGAMNDDNSYSLNSLDFNSYNQYEFNGYPSRFASHFESLKNLKDGTSKPMLNSEYDILMPDDVEMPKECYYLFELKRSLLIAPFLGGAGFYTWEQQFMHDPAYYTDLYSQANFLFQSTIGNVDFDAENFVSKKLGLPNENTPFVIKGKDKEDALKVIEGYTLIKQKSKNQYEDIAIGVVFNRTFNFVTYIKNNLGYFCNSSLQELRNFLTTVVPPSTTISQGFIDNYYEIENPIEYIPSNYNISMSVDLPTAQTYSIKTYNALTGQLITSVVQFGKPKLFLPILSSDNTCPIVYFIIKRNDYELKVLENGINDSLITMQSNSISNFFNYEFDSTNQTEENNMSAGIKLYPNPCENYINVEIFNLHYCNYISQVYTLDGRLIYENKHNSSSFTINTINFDRGIYIYKLITHEQSFHTKIIIQ